MLGISYHEYVYFIVYYMAYAMRSIAKYLFLISLSGINLKVPTIVISKRIKLSYMKLQN